MQLRQLEYFVTIAEVGSYSGASAQLYVAQPSLSQQIRKLEQELGAMLLERHSKGIRLTQSGAAFLDEARTILQAVEHSRKVVRECAEGRLGELKVLSLRSVISGLLAPNLTHWHDEYPGTVLNLQDFNHRRLLAPALFAGEGDVAIGPRPGRWPGDVISLGYEEMLIVSAASEGGRSHSVDPEGLRSLPWVLYEPDHGLSEVVDQLTSSHGFVPEATALSGQVETVISLAIEGVGVALVPENVIPDQWLGNAHAAGAGMFRELTAFTRVDPSPLATKFMDVLSELDLGLKPMDELPKGAILA